jgi:pimeloyl-ACP methyl ester carboxylesterase
MLLKSMHNNTQQGTMQKAPGIPQSARKAVPWLLAMLVVAGCGGTADTRSMDTGPRESGGETAGVEVAEGPTTDPTKEPATVPTVEAESLPRDISSVITAAPRDPATRINELDCWFTIPSGAPPVTCYRMQVPESHDRPNSRQIEFPLVRLSIPGGESGKTPVLHLGGGGPGNPLGLDADSIGNWIWDWYREFSIEDNRDLYLMDPRGVGMAQPVLVCSEYIPAFLDSLGKDLSISEEIAWNQRINRQCVDRLQREGVDFSSYNSRSVSEDVALLSQALGVKHWNLYGVSYGTRYALTLAREHPDLVESMVLDAAVFPNVRYMDHYGNNLEKAFQRLLEHCAADLTCRYALVDPEWRFWKLVRQLNQTPLRTTIQHPTENRPIDLVLNGERFLSVVYNTLYDADQFRDLPDIVNSLDRGELGIFEQKIDDWVAFQTDADYGDASAAAHFCYEESPFIDYEGAISEASVLRPELREASIALLRYNQEQCRRWPVPPGDAVEGEPVNTSIPTLFLHGALDPVLPVENLQSQLRHFSNADYEIFADVSHSIVGIHPCGETMASAFYNHKMAFRDHVSCTR